MKKNPSKKRLTAVAIALPIAALLILAVQKVENAKRERAAAAHAAPSTPTAASPGTAGSPGRERRTGMNGNAATASPDGRFEAEGSFVTTPNREGFRLKPFPIVKESDSFAWTAVDGKTPDAMKDLSHNDQEMDRLERSNVWTQKRQLVYCDDYIDSLGKSVASDPASVKSVKVPGLDGTEYDVEVTRTESPQGAQEWNVSGRLKDQPETIVSLSSVHGYTSFVVIAPDFYLEGDAREPGEVVVNQIDRQARRDALPARSAGVQPFNTGEPAPTARK